jgi:hypothetical protein
MVMLNETGVIGLILNRATESITGSMEMTILLVFLFILVISIMFSIPIEYLIFLVIPFCMVCIIYYSIFWLPLLIMFIYVATIITKNWIWR